MMRWLRPQITKTGDAVVPMKRCICWLRNPAVFQRSNGFNPEAGGGSSSLIVLGTQFSHAITRLWILPGQRTPTWPQIASTLEAICAHSVQLLCRQSSR